MYVPPPPESTNRILDIQEESETKLQIAGHFACNYSSFADTIVSKEDRQFGQISNPCEITPGIPGPGHGGPNVRCLDTWGPVGKNIAEIPDRSPKCQEARAHDFNKTKAMQHRPCGTLAQKPRLRYQNSGLSHESDELVGIWFKVKSHSSVFKEVAQSITTSDPALVKVWPEDICEGIGRLSLLKHLKMFRER